jgi:anti-sigma factor RsiW
VNCAEVRDLVLEHQSRRLPPEIDRVLEAHLATCAGCARVERAEHELTELLAARLPRAAAPPALVHRVAQLAPGPRRGRFPARPRRASVAWIAGAVAAAACLAAIATWTALGGRARGGSPLEAEAVNDHLRVLISQRPLEIESGGVHAVKPWFEGKLDFAPVVPDLAGLALRGGAIGYFHDRRAAVLQYQLRAHLVTLMEFQAHGLPLPDAPRATPGARGFQTALWRAGALGYALVADVDAQELQRVAGDVAAAAVGGSHPGP